MPKSIQELLSTYSRENIRKALEKHVSNSKDYAVRDATKVHTVNGRGFIPAKEKHIEYKPNVDITENVMGFMPVIDDILQGGQVALDFANGDYKNAALNAGLLFVPNVLEKPVKYAGKLLRRLPVSRALSDVAPYAGRNFVRHGVPFDYVSDVLAGESRAMTPSMAINRIDEFNTIGEVPFKYGDYTFIGDKSLLDDSMIFHGDAGSPVVGDIIYGFESVPSGMREDVAERLWLETINGPYKAIGKRVSVGDLSHLPTNQTDTYFEAIHHGTVPYERFKGVIAEEPGRHLYPTGLSKNKEEDILNWFDNNGVKVKTYDPLYKPYAGYNGWAESILDVAQDLGGDVLFRDGGGIHIKPSHRGRLTELKERTGKTEAELYNDGNPAHKKMVVFARNSRKWHGDGGLLRKFDTGGIIQKYGVGRIKAALAAIREMNSFNDDSPELSVTNYLENKDSLGWDAVNRRWYAPDVKGTDPNNRGMGVDIKTNSSILDGSVKLHKDGRGTYLTEDEEKTARLRSYNEAAKSARARVNYAKSVLKSESMPSSFKMTLLRDLIYNAGSGYVARNVFDEKKNPGFMKAFIDGTDSDAYDAIQKIHRKRNRGSRANDLDSIVIFDADKNGSFVIE